MAEYNAGSCGIGDTMGPPPDRDYQRKRMDHREVSITACRSTPITHGHSVGSFSADDEDMRGGTTRTSVAAIGDAVESYACSSGSDSEESSGGGWLLVPSNCKARGRHRRRIPKLVEPHRPKLDPVSKPWSAMVTQSLKRNDPRTQSPEAKEAVAAELAALRGIKTWDEDEVYELAEAKRLFEDGHFSRVFAIVGIKNHESQNSADWKWKGRVVFGGDAAKDARGDWAVFEEIGTVPTSMTAARVLLAASACCCRVIASGLMCRLIW